MVVTFTPPLLPIPPARREFAFLASLSLSCHTHTHTHLLPKSPLLYFFFLLLPLYPFFLSLSSLVALPCACTTLLVQTSNTLPTPRFLPHSASLPSPFPPIPSHRHFFATSYSVSLHPPPPLSPPSLLWYSDSENPPHYHPPTHSRLQEGRGGESHTCRTTRTNLFPPHTPLPPTPLPRPAAARNKKN